MSYVLSLDEGTTSARAIIFNEKAEIVGVGQHEFRQIYPQPGWVEHDPEDIWNAQLASINDALNMASLSISDISAIGITNQRETTILWDAKTGKPVYNAIVWQCRRTAQMAEEYAQKHKELIKKKTGLIPDSYFSAFKIKWILDNVPEARNLANQGRLRFGTIDSFLVWKLTEGKVHVTDVSNASRTMLMNIHTLQWDEELLELFGVPKDILPSIVPSSEIYGYATALGGKVPISGMAGDQQSALFGQACFEKGMVKTTYGTGTFILVNTGTKPRYADGLLTTVAWKIGEDAFYALEGSVFVSGSAVQWLRDGLGIIEKSADIEPLATSVPDNGGVYFVPALAGLGAPYWDPYARGLLIGITRATTRAHIARAVSEAIAYSTRDVIEVMKDSGVDIKQIRVDGGVSRNNFIMQFQSDMLGVPVVRPEITETTALGAAFLAGLSVRVWESIEEIQQIWKEEKVFTPSMNKEESDKLYFAWKQAVKRSLNWVKDIER